MIEGVCKKCGKKGKVGEEDWGNAGLCNDCSIEEGNKAEEMRRRYNL